MKTDAKGCSTCPNGQEHYEFFATKLGSKTLELVQYDYRTPDGVLFSCVSKSLEIARERRDKWVEGRND